MPYIIAVLMMVIVGTGYALLQKDSLSLQTAPIEKEEMSAETIDNQIVTKTSPDEENQEFIPKKENVALSAPDTSKPIATKEVPKEPEPSPQTKKITTYSDGTYSATKSYRTPDGTYEMSLQLTIHDDIVTASSLAFDTDGARDRYSKRFQNGYQSQVIGNSLSSVSLSRVGGASLTTNAFNSAVANIKSQAS